MLVMIASWSTSPFKPRRSDIDPPGHESDAGASGNAPTEAFASLRREHCIMQPLLQPSRICQPNSFEPLNLSAVPQNYLHCGKGLSPEIASMPEHRSLRAS